jgi:hypothetical protein
MPAAARRRFMPCQIAEATGKPKGRDGALRLFTFESNGSGVGPEGGAHSARPQPAHLNLCEVSASPSPPVRGSDRDYGVEPGRRQGDAPLGHPCPVEAGINAQKGSLRWRWRWCRCRGHYNRGRLLDVDLRRRRVTHLGAREASCRRYARADADHEDEQPLAEQLHGAKPNAADNPQSIKLRAALASDDGPIFSTVSELVEALKRTIPECTQNAELKMRTSRSGAKC